jgi:hypothetical protein
VRVPTGTVPFLAVAFSTATALAQAPSDHARAEALSDAAATARASGETEQECARLEASARLEPSAARLILVAECTERLGRTATAWATYGRAAVLARRDGVAQDLARSEAEAQRLEPALVKLSVVVPEPHQLIGLEVFQDGVLVDPALYGVGVAVDPGPHRLVARAPRHVSWSTEIGMPAAPGPVSVTIPMLGLTAVSPAAQARSGAPAATPVVDDPGSTQETVGWVVSGTGVALLSGGVVATLVANRRQKDIEGQCSMHRVCSADARDDFEAMRTSRNAAFLLFATGGVALASGVVIYAVSPRPSASGSALGVAPFVAPGSAGLFASGRF